MKNKFSVFFLMSVLVVALVTQGFQCSSAEMTSARLYVQRSDWENAQSSLEKELTNNPQNEEAWYLLGRVKSEKKDFVGMNEAFDKALSISNAHGGEIQRTRLSFWSQYFNRGVTYFSKGHDSTQYFDRAIEAFETAVVINPDSTATYKNLGFSYVGKGNAEGAIAPLQEVLKRENDVQAAKLLGEIYYDMGVRHRTAFEALGSENIDSTEYRTALENFDEAIAYLEKARSWDPQDEDVMTVLMNAYIALNRTEEAKEQFRQGAELHPKNQYYQYNYGVLLLKEGEYPEAIERFQKAVEADPEYESALYNLGVAYVNWGVEMREAAEAAAQKKGRGAKVDESYKEKFKSALPSFNRVLDLRPDDAELWEQLGRVYANLNMQTEARNAFDKADNIRQGQ
ncbi:MAG: tetratricopeptide repeat protein [Bacteroidota bacterium]